MAGLLHNVHAGDVIDDGLTALLLIVSQFLVSEVAAGEGHILLHVLVVYLRRSEIHLRVWEGDFYLFALPAHILFGESREVDIGLERGIHRDGHLSFAGRQIDAEILIRQIQQDIRLKDLESLREHFDQFCEKYEHQTIFSQIYIKFMFSNLLKEIYDNLERKDERELDREIDALYHSSNMAGVIQAVRMGIDRLETVFRADGGVAKRREVEQIKQYIRENYSDSGMGVDQLAREVGMTPNYLSSIFKKNTGENLSRYLKGFRMERAREMLENTNEKIGVICEKCGFVNVSYFCQSFREYFGISPQKYRDQGE